MFCCPICICEGISITTRVVETLNSTCSRSWEDAFRTGSHTVWEGRGEHKTATQWGSVVWTGQWVPYHRARSAPCNRASASSIVTRNEHVQHVGPITNSIHIRKPSGGSGGIFAVSTCAEASSSFDEWMTVRTALWMDGWIYSSIWMIVRVYTWPQAHALCPHLTFRWMNDIICFCESHLLYKY